MCKNLDIICETEYFGLVEQKTNTTTTTGVPTNYEWINLRNPLPPSTTNGPLQLELRVKFWVPPHLILQDNVRNIVYMQARQDLLDGRLKSANWSQSAKMAALLVQADKLIKFDPAALTTPTTVSPLSSPMVIDVDIPAVVRGTDTVDRKCKKRRLSRHKSSISIDLTPAVTQAELPTPLTPYEAYVIRPVATDATESSDRIPDGFFKEIAKEHGKMVSLKMSPNSAKYWLLETVSKLNGFGEEVFSGYTHEPTVGRERCDVSVGPHGIMVTRDDKQIR